MLKDFSVFDANMIHEKYRAMAEKFGANLPPALKWGEA